MVVDGTSGNDTLNGTSDDDTLNGFGGNDELVGSGGNDFYDGGSGNGDTLELKFTSTPTVVDFRDGTLSGGFSGTFVNIERVISGDGNDSLIGAAGAQNLSSRAGNDTLEGGAGNDWLWGGGGDDTYIFRETGTSNADRFGDFASGSDKIVLDATVMDQLGAEGNFSAGDARFTANSSGTAQDASDRVIYETDTRQIWYDPDGNGGAVRQLIGTLQSGATLAAADIAVQGAGTPPPGGVNGTEGNDTLVGTPGDDTINGLGGNDSLSGLDGNDSLSGGDGNDTLDGGNGADTLDGGLGDDTYVGNRADTFIDAGGTDTLISFDVFMPMPDGLENLILRGGPFDPGNDIYTSSGLGNELDNLIVNERSGSSGLDGGAGNDTLIGSATGGSYFEFSSGGTGNYGNDVVDGNGGGAILLAPGNGITVNFQTGMMTGGGIGSVSFINVSRAEGSRGADLMIGNDSDMVLYGQEGNDTLTGGAGDDWLTGDGFIPNGAPEFTLGDDSISGGGGNDTILGGRGDDSMDGGAGNDVFDFTFEFDYGSDTVAGGAGTDQIVMFNLSSVTVDLGAGTLVGGESDGGGSVSLTGIENYQGLGAASRITGNADANVLIGANGNLGGASLDDTINGAAGNDTLTGGNGADQFLFDHLGTAEADRVTDFASGDDKIVLDTRAMAALGPSGTFAPNDERFYTAAGASAGHDATDRVVYDSSSGNLWYDADGSGGGAAQLIATLDGAPTVSAVDIAVNSPDGPIATDGTAGDDTLVGGPGDDTLNGLAGNDSLVGNDGDDMLDGGSDVDTLDGGAGNDTYFVTSGDALVDASGADMVISDGSWTLESAFEYLTLIGTGNWEARGNTSDNALIGNSGNNRFDLQGGSDSVVGGAGNDTLDMSTGGVDAHFGADQLDGGDGIDTVNFDGFAVSAVHVILQHEQSAIFGGSNDGTGFASVHSIENAIGGSFDDTLIGSAVANLLEGRGGNDTLAGHLGDDTLIGGAGADVFAFQEVGAADADHIVDFATGSERIHLDANAMTALGTTGNFAAGDARFYATAGASAGHDADDRVVYDTASGNLWYDPDGSGAQAAQLVAILDGAASLGATDIVVDNGSAPPDGGQHLVGTPNDDSVVGGDGNDTIEGLGGFDTLVGAGGDDSLAGGSGWDTVTGGAGEDTFAFTEFGHMMNDRIMDFTSGSDVIQLDPSVFMAIGASGAFTVNDPRFYAAAGAGAGHDADDRIIYDTSSGIVYYDPDGSGGAAQSNLAILDGAPTLVATDFVVQSAGTPAPAAINGTEGDDTLVGTAADDTINGLGGNDSLDGGLGEDQLIGGDGNDTLDGSLFNTATADTLNGGLGDDRFQVDHPGDVLIDDGGIDTVDAFDVDWTLSAGFENLTLDADATLRTGIGNDLDNDLRVFGSHAGRLEGRGGNDTLGAGNQAAFLFGEDGDDSLAGGGGPDSLDGGTGNDTLIGGLDFDTLTGGAGADRFVYDARGSLDEPSETSDRILDFASGVDNIVLDARVLPQLGASGTLAPDDARFYAAAGATGGHDADDRLVYDTDSGQLYYDEDGDGAAQADVILMLSAGTAAAALAAQDISVINGSSPSGASIDGTSANDTLTGTDGNDTLNGFGGNDELVGSGGNDFYDGGSGNNDTLELKFTPTPTIVDFRDGSISGGFTGTFANMERVVSGDGNDGLTGAAGAQNLSSRAGDDTLEGGAGNDWLWGGGGDDTFIFREAGGTNADRFGDFASGADTIAFDNGTLSALGAEGDFAGGDARFYAAAGATAGHDASDRIIYNTSTGQLYYDDDGSGAHAAQLVATLQGGATLAATDISVL